MTGNQFARAIRRQPFRPFSLVMADGRTFTVDHPDFVSIDRRAREVTFYAGDNTMHLLEASLIAQIVMEDDNPTVSAGTAPDDQDEH